MRPPGAGWSRFRSRRHRAGGGPGCDEAGPTPSVPGRGAGRAIEETCTNLRTSARSAARPLARSEPGPRSLRGAPLPAPAPAAETTASAPDSSTATLAEAASRSQRQLRRWPFGHRRRGPGSDQPYGRVAALGQQALEQERDLPVPARDHYAHAVSLLAGITGRSDDVASGPCCDPQGTAPTRRRRLPGSAGGVSLGPNGSPSCVQGRGNRRRLRDFSVIDRV